MGTKLTNEQVSQIDEMLRKIVNKNKNKIKMEFDDVLSELWINALKIIEKDNEVRMEIIAKSSKNRIVDLVRKNVKNEHLPYDNLMFERCLPIDLRMESTNPDEEYTTYIFHSNSNIEESELEVLEILDLFEEGSKERLFVETWMKILGIIKSTDEIPDKALDGYIAKDVLGYAGSSSNGYGRIRWRVREVLVENGYRLNI